MIRRNWLISSAISEILSSYGGVAKAVSARIAIAWKKFRELSEVLIGKQGDL